MDVPKAGERVRVLGHCAARLIGQVVEVVEVFMEDGELWWTCRYFRDGEPVSTTGLLVSGWLEPAPGHEVFNDVR